MKDAMDVLTGQRVHGTGGALATDVYRPRTSSPLPAVLIRTPYGRSAHLSEALGWVGHGFAVVVQDVRGRYDSGGSWDPYRGERDDGAATALWIVDQTWSDGRIVVAGGSYAAFTAWSTAVTVPELTAAVVSSVPAMGWYHVKFDPCGILRLADHTAWWVTYAETRTGRHGLAKAMLDAEPALLAHLPVRGIGRMLWADLPGWTQVIDRGPTPGPEEVTTQEMVELPVPSLHIGGWYDPLLADTVAHWRLVGSACTPRPARKLILGPWRHTLLGGCSTSVGDRDHGPQSQVSLGRLQVGWVDEVLGREPAGDTLEPEVPEADAMVFVVNDNRWDHRPDWPPPTRPLRLYAAARGTLEAELPTDTDVVTFLADPATPVPSRLLPADRSDLEGRPDNVVFTSDPLPDDLRIAGVSRLVLRTTIDVPDADFVARICEVGPDGTSWSLARGCVVAAVGTRTYEVELSPVDVVVIAGTRLRLSIASSDFPDLARNLQTGQDRYVGCRSAAATHTIHLGGPCATSLELPLVIR